MELFHKIHSSVCMTFYSLLVANVVICGSVLIDLFNHSATVIFTRNLLSTIVCLKSCGVTADAPMLQSTPPKPLSQIQSFGLWQVPWTQPGYSAHWLHSGPCHPLGHLANNFVKKRQMSPSRDHNWWMHAGKTVWSLDNACHHTWALLRWGCLIKSAIPSVHFHLLIVGKAAFSVSHRYWIIYSDKHQFKIDH